MDLASRQHRQQVGRARTACGGEVAHAREQIERPGHLGEVFGGQPDDREHTAGPQHPSRFPQRLLPVLHLVQHGHHRHRVDAVIGARQRTGVTGQHVQALGRGLGTHLGTDVDDRHRPSGRSHRLGVVPGAASDVPESASRCDGQVLQERFHQRGAGTPRLVVAAGLVGVIVSQIGTESRGAGDNRHQVRALRRLVSSQDLVQRFQPSRQPAALLDLGAHLPQLGTDDLGQRSVVVAVEKRGHLLQLESELAQRLNAVDPFDVGGGVDPVPVVLTPMRHQQPQPVVVVQRPDRQAGRLGDLTDFQSVVCHVLDHSRLT